MNARKKLLTILPVFASLAVIGSGFSVWYFGNGTTNAGQDMSVGIEQVAEVGSITTAKGLKLIFDQTEEGRKTNGGKLDLGDGPNGIYLEYSGDGSTSAIYTSKADETNVDYTDYVENEFYYQFTTTITVSEKLATYVSINYENKTETPNNWKRSSVKTNSETSAEETTFTAEYGVNTFDWTCVKFTYKENKEPKDIDEYKTLSNIINTESTTIKVNYTVSLVKTASN